ncbi:2-oxoacid:ferredoxin oxidoreductase subunit beta [Nocardioides marmoriginsengisoli]|uniref:2-oxoacid:ferredoxin oxidoreductase subunit beta n=1 Tax=Nocardioides marmoriginsengisoli TaxID=661483 RepID=A0A3N0CHZ2_9ACTN|nr:2-oxoacid:ferredoxin oxidoreductase subunit beta [Nocardioides marmoriginsengisoli]RNL62901.1 2-oxoacid:ferredoxin oxidoreductase subunit beta [Nocardioides marmoriginsengisoli]
MTAYDLGIPTVSGLDGVPTTDQPSTPADFKSDQEVRWCPGCGDYVVLNTMQSFLPTLGLRRENIVFVSGIGCSSRFPYYMDTYGFHSIHGRATAIATGLAVERPDLSVWVITGDGDSLSIGGNHLIHLLRRNVNVKVLLFNNRIYGLTKGQYSPTSEVGKRTKSSPAGSVDHPFNPLALALGADATFVGRALDSDKAGLTEVLSAAARHRGSAFVEIYQNCPIFNDGAFDALKDKHASAGRLLRLGAGQPMTFGADERKYAVVGDGPGGLTIADASNVAPDDVVVHQPDHERAGYSYALARLDETFPEVTPVGIFRDVVRPTYDDEVRAQISGQAMSSERLQDVLLGKDSWLVG